MSPIFGNKMKKKKCKRFKDMSKDRLRKQVGQGQPAILAISGHVLDGSNNEFFILLLY